MCVCDCELFYYLVCHHNPPYAFLTWSKGLNSTLFKATLKYCPLLCHGYILARAVLILANMFYYCVFYLIILVS